MEKTRHTRRTQRGRAAASSYRSRLGRDRATSEDAEANLKSVFEKGGQKKRETKVKVYSDNLRRVPREIALPLLRGYLKAFGSRKKYMRASTECKECGAAFDYVVGKEQARCVECRRAHR